MCVKKGNHERDDTGKGIDKFFSSTDAFVLAAANSEGVLLQL